MKANNKKKGGGALPQTRLVSCDKHGAGLYCLESGDGSHADPGKCRCALRLPRSTKLVPALRATAKCPVTDHARAAAALLALVSGV